MSGKWKSNLSKSNTSWYLSRGGGRGKKNSERFAHRIQKFYTPYRILIYAPGYLFLNGLKVVMILKLLYSFITGFNDSATSSAHKLVWDGHFLRFVKIALKLFYCAKYWSITRKTCCVNHIYRFGSFFVSNKL